MYKEKIFWVRAVLILLIVLNLVFIFYNSSLDSKKSGEISKDIANNTLEIVDKDYSEKPKSEKNKSLIKTNIMIRKMAHSAEFFPLGALVTCLGASFLCVRNEKIKKLTGLLLALLISGVLCALLGLLDETCQLFVEGREFRMLDVLYDFLGSFAGSALAALIIALVFRRKNASLEETV